jgi:hypothetical protein
VTEEIEASIRIEAGVLAIYSVALKENPAHLRFFEIYADENAYRQHIESPHSLSRHSPWRWRAVGWGRSTGMEWSVGLINWWSLTLAPATARPRGVPRPSVIMSSFLPSQSPWRL